MPKDPSIKRILVIGSGPIVIGQGCEFDYSGVQACKALREEGYEVVLINSNPATIMTDPEFAFRTYIEPITPEIVEKIIIKEKPDVLLPTLGGQTALNTAMSLHHSGVLEKHGVRMIGAKPDAIEKGEDRLKFKNAMLAIGLDLPQSGVAHTIEEARKIAEEIGTLPLIIRPAYTLGGTGGGIAYNKEEFETITARGLDLSPVSEVLIEESLLGWKEFEMEVMRDKADNCVIICSIENLDPMGVHTGDSITVAPIQTLTDREYQIMRDASFACIREIGVETGGSNIQFAIHPDTGRMIVIEMNPRVSRSSALASKATGYPIAKIAAKLAVGYTLDELKNDITRETPASFEPTIDYVVTKIPRFTFEKFPGADTSLTTQMKSVGEAMAIGRTFKESLQKALRSLEIKRFGLIGDGADVVVDEETLTTKLTVPNAERIFFLGQAFAIGWDVEKVFSLTKIDRWFLRQIEEIVKETLVISDKALAIAECRNDPEFIRSRFDLDPDNDTDLELAQDKLEKLDWRSLSASEFRRYKKLGFSDAQLAHMCRTRQKEIRAARKKLGIIPTYRLVDTCAAEFEAQTPYYYSTYGTEDEVRDNDRKKVMILGGGPNRIGQGIEFDYCCVHASFALRELGYETIMVNSNPETVSTDYDTSDKLYFEPLTLEDVLNIYERENRNDQVLGVIVQFGGQTPLNLAKGLEENGVRIIGTSPKNIELAEDRKLFAALLDELGLHQAASGTATSLEEALAITARIGYPSLVRPSFVLGGRAMQIVYSDAELTHYMKNAVEATPDRPVLVDRFLEDATEVDVDCISDGETTVIGAIMEHIEEAGIHSGDSACVIPPFSLGAEMQDRIRDAAKKLAKALGVRGLMNMQLAVKGDDLYVIEVNPRASRTAPFVSKAIGVPLPKLAAKIMAGKTLKELGFTEEVHPKHFSVKEAVFPFSKFQGVDIALGPEMKSTGEVMGIDMDMGLAFAKSQMAAGGTLPTKGNVFISVKETDRANVARIAQGYADLGFTLYATAGTGQVIKDAGTDVNILPKLASGQRPNVIDLMKNKDMALVINTPSGKNPREDEIKIRTAAMQNRIPIMTTLRGADAAMRAIKSLQAADVEVRALQEYHQ
ncbi:carbamoyl-phosphate synthase large subunit [Prosthecobacter dejongeii]|uniref:Carbamoyl phosphate synthase large chain n=1 Tax=Prosthecobacter dejongeii TaxID=48465 RepID=A0A7W7YI92_9BACT|nr:carbamoyl-phosphate synthase large subunit [Prosthecobacter dejongeii]MBB5036629.1 carbamoyl-phosphate synthase large subunit [Prosthecobacter dejongeii]